MISKELTTWFQEEVKKEIADVIDQRGNHPMTISLFDEKGIVWVEGFKHTRIEPFEDEVQYLIHYSIHREEDLKNDFPFSISITVME
jgi:hypothetical protein